jgi:site-specific recombinase XerD
LDRSPHGSHLSGSKKRFFDYPEPNPGIIGTTHQRGDLMAHQITLKQACEGLVQYKTAVGLSPHTISDYKNTFKKLFLFFDNKIQLEEIDRKKMVEFFAWLQEDYISNPDGVAPHREKPLAPKSIRNIHTNLSALWTWAVKDDFVKMNIVAEIEKPTTLLV